MSATTGGATLQIGEVAEATGLSVRTIRWYGEVGLVEPSERSKGGFRLYTEADVDRLQLVKRMKPLDFTLEEMGDLLGVVDALEAADADQAERLLDRLGLYAEAVQDRLRRLEEQVETARRFADDLARQRGRARRRVGALREDS